MVAGRDWSGIKSEYAATSISYRELAEKHGIPFNTLKDRAKKDKWGEARKEHHANITKKTLNKVASKIATDHAKELLHLKQSAQKMAAYIDSMLDDEKQFRRHLIEVEKGEGFGKSWTKDKTVKEKLFKKIDTKAIKDLAGALKDLTGVITRVCNIPSVVEQSAMDIAAQRLELDRHKAGVGDEDDNETGVIILPDVLPGETDEIIEEQPEESPDV